MKKSIAAGLMAITALSGGAALAPSLASAQEDSAPEASAPEAVEQVAPDGEGRRGHRHGHQTPEVVLDLLGVTQEDLAAARADGQSVADVAVAQGIAVEDVVQALVDEANVRIDEKLADGSIDAEKAAEIQASLEERITAKVNGERPERGEGRGPRGPRGGGEGTPVATA